MTQRKAQEGYRNYQRRHNGRSLDEYSRLKLLPHINQQYQFRITNKLLVHKISNPRRDHIIMDSLAHTSYSKLYKNKNGAIYHQQANNYRRKLMLTAARKKRQKYSDGHDWDSMKRDQVSSVHINAKSFLNNSIQKSEGAQQENEGEQQFKNNDLTTSKMVNMHVRDDYIGKIVRNQSSSCVIRPAKKGIMRGNYCLNHPFEEQPPKQTGKQRSQHLIKKIARRIYQDRIIDKQN